MQRGTLFLSNLLKFQKPSNPLKLNAFLSSSEWPSAPDKVKRANRIKRLHKENKDLFGDLVETKQEKVKRTRVELKLAKGMITKETTGNKKTAKKAMSEVTKSEILEKNESLLAGNEHADKNADNNEMLLKMEKRKRRSEKNVNLLKVGWLPRAESIRIEHAGTSINKNPIKLDVGQDNMMTERRTSSSSGVTLKAHKKAEIEWNLRSAPPTMMKLIELSTTTSSANDHLQDSPLTETPLLVDDVNEHEQEDIVSISRPDYYSSSSLLSTTSPTPKLPSVTKILQATMSAEQAMILKRWEEKMIAQMGEEGFRQYKESILTNGKMLHGNIESYLRGTPEEMISVAEPNQGHWNSLSGILHSIENVSVLESHVIHPSLQYCGVIDCVAEFSRGLVLIDWKTSQKPKPSLKMTYDTPLQIAAYIGAINEDTRYALKVDMGLIVVAYEDGSSCQTFVLSEKQIDTYWKLWLKRLEQYKKNNPVLGG